MSSSKIFRIITTKYFRTEATHLLRKYPNIKSDFLQLAESLKKDPITGSTPLGKDCYKIRMPISDKGKGQSGGARVIVNVLIQDEEVYVLSVYDKSEKSTVLDGELKRLLERKSNL